MFYSARMHYIDQKWQKINAALVGRTNLTSSSSYSYPSQNVSLILIRRALIMKRVLTEPGKKKKNCTQLDRSTTNQSTKVSAVCWSTHSQQNSTARTLEEVVK